MSREGERIMSYSFQEPELPPYCECTYDEVHDTVDSEDCMIHFDMQEGTVPLLKKRQPQEPRSAPKKPAAIAKRADEERSMIKKPGRRLAQGEV